MVVKTFTKENIDEFLNYTNDPAEFIIRVRISDRDDRLYNILGDDCPESYSDEEAYKLYELAHKRSKSPLTDYFSLTHIKGKAFGEVSLTYKSINMMTLNDFINMIDEFTEYSDITQLFNNGVIEYIKLEK